MERPTIPGAVGRNGHEIVRAVVAALRAAGQGDRVLLYLQQATAGDYQHLLAVSRTYCDFHLTRPSTGHAANAAPDPL